MNTIQHYLSLFYYKQLLIFNYDYDYSFEDINFISTHCNYAIISFSNDLFVKRMRIKYRTFKNIFFLNSNELINTNKIYDLIIFGSFNQNLIKIIAENNITDNFIILDNRIYNIPNFKMTLPFYYSRIENTTLKNNDENIFINISEKNFNDLNELNKINEFKPINLLANDFQTFQSFLIDNNEYKKIISYSQVSTQENNSKTSAKKINKFCNSRNIKIDEHFEDIMAGSRSDRPSFQKIVQMIINGEVKLLIIENKDTLIDSDYEILELIFKHFGCEILIINENSECKTHSKQNKHNNLKQKGK
jgi:hypothetical protein